MGDRCRRRSAVGDRRRGAGEGPPRTVLAANRDRAPYCREGAEAQAPAHARMCQSRAAAQPQRRTSPALAIVTSRARRLRTLRRVRPQRCGCARSRGTPPRPASVAVGGTAGSACAHRSIVNGHRSPWAKPDVSADVTVRTRGTCAGAAGREAPHPRGGRMRRGARVPLRTDPVVVRSRPALQVTTPRASAALQARELRRATSARTEVRRRLRFGAASTVRRRLRIR